MLPSTKMRLPTLSDAPDLELHHVGIDMLLDPVAAEIQRLDVGIDQLFLALELLAEQPLDFRLVDVEQDRQRADVDDVLEQLALAGVGVSRVGDRRERHADHVDVLAEHRRRHRLGRIVEQIAARRDLLHVLRPGLRIHRDHHVDAAAPAEITLLGDADLVPGRQALDVRREDVARADRHAHAQDRSGEQLVGRGRSRPVDVRELDDEIVNGG